MKIFIFFINKSNTISVFLVFYLESSKPHPLQSITEEGMHCDLDNFIIREKLALGNMWTANHR